MGCGGWVFRSCDLGDFRLVWDFGVLFVGVVFLLIWSCWWRCFGCVVGGGCLGMWSGVWWGWFVLFCYPFFFVLLSGSACWGMGWVVFA